MKSKTTVLKDYYYEAKVCRYDLEACLQIYLINRLIAVKALAKCHPGMSYQTAKSILEEEIKNV